MATSTNSLIRVTDVCKEYNGGSVHALSHCNLSVKKGEVMSIIGAVLITVGVIFAYKTDKPKAE